MCGKRAVSRSEFFPLIFLALSDRKIVGTEFFAARVIDGLIERLNFPVLDLFTVKSRSQFFFAC